MASMKEKFSYDNPKFGAIREAARGVTAAFGAQNKWLDTIQEWFYIERGMKHVSNLIHGIAHRALVYLDEFSDILHERHLATEYPYTPELDEEFADPADAFSAVIDILDETGAALSKFRETAEIKRLYPMALSTENLMMKVSAEQTAVLALWKMWEQGVSAASMDNWALHYKDGGVG